MIRIICCSFGDLEYTYPDEDTRAAAPSARRTRIRAPPAMSGMRTPDPDLLFMSVVGAVVGIISGGIGSEVKIQRLIFYHLMRFLAYNSMIHIFS